MKSDAYKILSFPSFQYRFEKLGYKLEARLEGEFKIENLKCNTSVFLDTFDQVHGYLIAVEANKMNIKEG